MGQLVQVEELVLLLLELDRDVHFHLSEHLKLIGREGMWNLAVLQLARVYLVYV